MKHAVKHLRFPEAAVEPIAEFPQVAGQMFGTDAVVDAPNIAFDIGDQGVDPGQDLRCLLPRNGHQPLMLEIGRSIKEAIALPAIGLDHRFRCQALPYQGLNLYAADPGHQAHGGKPGFIGEGFHGYHHLGLASRAPGHVCRVSEPRSRCRPSRSSQPICSLHLARPWLDESCGP